MNDCMYMYVSMILSMSTCMYVCMYAIIHPYTTSPSHEGRNERRLVSSEDGGGRRESTVVSVWYRYASFGRVRDSFDDDGVHNLDDQRGKSLCV